MATVSVCVWINGGGAMLCPWADRGPDSSRSYFVGGARSFALLSQTQLIASLRVMFQDPAIDKSDTTAYFFDGADWVARGKPSDNKGQLLLTLQFPVSPPAAPVS